MLSLNFYRGSMSGRRWTEAICTPVRSPFHKYKHLNFGVWSAAITIFFPVLKNILLSISFGYLLRQGRPLLFRKLRKLSFCLKESFCSEFNPLYFLTCVHIFHVSLSSVAATARRYPKENKSIGLPLARKFNPLMESYRLLFWSK
jgi:hypothetical protein